nr:ribonuclease H-like domain-containing protein [Tanacetum cinerariifolium]
MLPAVPYHDRTNSCFPIFGPTLFTSPTAILHGMLSHYKARLMANSSAQLEGVDVDKTSSPVVKPEKYVVEILDRAHMVNCNPSWTPIDTESKLRSDGDPVSNPTLHQILACSLQCITFTRPDI